MPLSLCNRLAFSFTLLVSGKELESATAQTVGPDGAIYVSTKGDRSGVGQVVRIEKTEAIPEPTQ